jgi:hypothetical protein
LSRPAAIRWRMSNCRRRWSRTHRTFEDVGHRLTSRLESAFTARFQDLPEISRAVLLVAALDDGADLAEVLSATGHLRGHAVPLDALVRAEAAQLINISGGEVYFRHPLIRSAIQQTASLSNRMAAHAALADILEHDPDRRAWHRAAAVIGRNEAVAEDLDRIAETARSRGATIVSVKALRPAAELTLDPARRLDRLLRAGETAFELGHRDTVASIVEQAEPLMPLVKSASERGRMELVRGLGASRVLHEDQLRSLVAIAEQSRDVGDANLAWNLLWRLAQRCFWADPGPEARNIIVKAAESAPPFWREQPSPCDLSGRASRRRLAASASSSFVAIYPTSGWTLTRTPQSQMHWKPSMSDQATSPLCARATRCCVRPALDGC